MADIIPDEMYFVGVAGVGMSPLAIYCAGLGKRVYGSDRAFKEGVENQDIKELSPSGIVCVAQDGAHIPQSVKMAVVSAAVEDTNPDIRELKSRGVPIIQRSELLANIVASYEGGSVCVAGTAGKSSTTLMTYHLCRTLAGSSTKLKSPRLIAGAADNKMKRRGEAGNADYLGNGLLIFEGDESDKSVVRYHPTHAIVTNIGHDHHDMDVTLGLFQTLADQTSQMVVLNSGDPLVRTIDCGAARRVTFALEELDPNADFVVSAVEQTSDGLRFKINGVDFTLGAIGLHNALNVAAAVALVCSEGADISEAAKEINTFGGIYRRGNIVGRTPSGALMVDDFAHTPEEVAETIRTLSGFSAAVHAVYQPHGFGPLRNTYKEMAELLKAAMKPQDVLYLLPVYYEGGTTDMSVGSKEVSRYFIEQGIRCKLVENRDDLPQMMLSAAGSADSVAVMGARDKSLAKYTESFLSK